METSDEWRSSGVGIGTSAVEHLCQWHGQWDWVHPQQVCWWHEAVWCDQHTGVKGYHPEGPGQAWEVGLCEPHEVQQGQVQGPAHGSGRSQSQKTGWVENGLRAALRRRTWGCWWTRSSTWAGSVRSQPRRPTISWATSEEAWLTGRGRWFCPSALLWWDPTQSPVSSSGALSTAKTWSCWNGSRGGPQKWSEGWNTFLVKEGSESVRAVQPGEEKAPGRPYSSLPVPEGDLWESWRGTFYKGM